MDVPGLIGRIQDAGFTLAVVGGNLAVSPASRLSESQRAFIRQNKPAIIAALVGNPAEAVEDHSEVSEARPSRIAGRVRCCDCLHQQPTGHTALVLCGAGRESPATCGSWWKFDPRSCDRFQASPGGNHRNFFTP